MDKNTVYILQKDLPNVNAGAEIKLSRAGTCYNCIDKNGLSASFQRKLIECNPDWFKPKEEVNESKPTEQFQWTNELVMEFVNFHDEQKGIHWLSEDIEKFKQSKSKKEEPQWEILEVTDKAGKIWERYFYNGDPHICGNNYEYVLQSKIGRIFDIKTVKRFPDNTVWSVDGSYFINGYMATLKRFELSENGKMIVYFNGLNIGYELSELPTEKAPKEEQVPIKVEIMEFGYGKPQENKGNFYVANFNLPNNAKLPTEKYQSIKSAIEDELNGKTEHEKLLSKIEKKVKLANVINTHANYLRETLDLIKSLNK